MKITLSREFYIPKNPMEVTSSDCSAVAYIGESRQGSGKLVACGFSGKRNRPDFNFTFKNEAQAREHIARHAAGVKATEAARIEYRAKRQAGKCCSVADVWNKAQKDGNLVPADVAVCLRAVLSREFPGVKFSVRSDRGLNVRWTDGPISKAVESIAKNYSFQGFDGMIDLRYSIDRWLAADGTMSLARSAGTEGSRGTCSEAIGSPHSASAVLVSSYCDFVFCNRDISPAVKRALAVQVCGRRGIPMPDSFADDSAFERFLNTTQSGGDYLSQLVWRASNGTDES